MLTTSNPPSTITVPVATTAAEGKTKVDNDMTGDPIAVTTHSIGIPSGVAELDSGGLVPVAELPLDVAYTDVENTFSKMQTVDLSHGYSTQVTDTDIYQFDPLGGETDLFAGSLSLFSGIPNSGINVESPDPSFVFIEASDTITFGSVVATGSGLDVNSNSVLLVPATYSLNGLGEPATNIHQDVDGTIHFQVAPSGVAFSPITWIDALIINNDGTLTLNTPLDSTSLPVDVAYTDVQNTFTVEQKVDDGAGNITTISPTEVLSTDITTAYTEIASGGISVIDPTFHGASLSPGTGFLEGADPSYWILDTSDTLLRGSFTATGTGVDITNGVTPSPTPGNYYHYPRADIGSGVHLDIDGSVTLRTAPAAAIGTPVVWTDALTTNPDGTIDLASTPTTTTAPSAGMADALPVLPTGYATIEIGGTPRQIAYY